MVQLKFGYRLVTSEGNLVPIGSSVVVGRLANSEDNSLIQSTMSQPRVGSEFTHFISLSFGNHDEQLKGIEKFQNMLQNVEGIGKKKNLKKMHVTMMTLNATQEEPAAILSGFRHAGDRFTYITGEGPFIIGFRGLEQGDGEEPPDWRLQSL